MSTRTLLAAEDLKPFGFARRTAGNIVVSSASWVDLDNGLDLVLPAATGDVVEVAANGLWNNEAAQNGNLDVATIVSAAVVNYVSSAASVPVGDGIVAWQAEALRYGYPGPPMMLTLVSGDISSGTVRLRLRCRNPAAGTRTLFANSTIPFYWQARNLGPKV